MCALSSFFYSDSRQYSLEFCAKILHILPLYMAKRVRTHVNPLSITKEHAFPGFPNVAPIIVDVGACKGEFITALIEKFPEKNFLVFEIRYPLYKKLLEQFADMPNVAVFDGDAGRNLPSILRTCREQGSSLETLYVNFPDPWFKARHHKRRFLNAGLLKALDPLADGDTEIIFQTDQKLLFDNTVEIIQESQFSHIEYFDTAPHRTPTHWEQQKLLEGAPIYRMKFRKSG